jgi:hypothetical protein
VLVVPEPALRVNRICATGESSTSIAAAVTPPNDHAVHVLPFMLYSTVTVSPATGYTATVAGSLTRLVVTVTAVPLVKVPLIPSRWLIADSH